MSTRRPAYLLKGDDDEFERWRAAAAAKGQTFATYARSALNDKTSSLVESGDLPKWLHPEPKKRRKR